MVAFIAGSKNALNKSNKSKVEREREGRGKKVNLNPTGGSSKSSFP